jgi:hypothetical protein
LVGIQGEVAVESLRFAPPRAKLLDGLIALTSRS